MYHLVFPAKYRRKVFTDRVKKMLKVVCIGMEKRYEIRFLEIGMEEDHVHFLVQAVPMYSPTKIVRTIKSITGHPLGGLYQIHLDDGRMVHLQSGLGARQFASAYGSLGDAIGKRIRYRIDNLNVMSYFEPVDDVYNQ